MIHSQLAVAPSIPHVQKNQPQETAATTVEQLPSVEKAEVAYIPASMRQKVVTIQEEDSIVVVGQAKQKKRKRISKTNALHKAAERTSEPEKEQESFDFATVPNMLDDGSDHEPTQGVVKKKSKRQGMIIENMCYPWKLNYLGYSKFLWRFSCTTQGSQSA